MKINSIEIEEYHQRLEGINPGKFTGFTDVICLVGKNGSGKTRILKIIENEIKRNAIYYYLNNDIDIDIAPTRDYSPLEKHSSIFRVAKESFYKNGYNTSEGKSILEDEFENISVISDFHLLSSLTKNIEAKIKGQIVVIDYTKLKTLNQSRNPLEKFINTDVVPSLERIREDISNATLNPIQQILLTPNDFENTIDSVYRSGLQYLEDLAKQLAYEKIMNYDNVENQLKTENYARYLILKNLITQLLAKKIEYKIDNSKLVMGESIGGISGSWFLNDRAFKYSDLSDGEKVLFSFAFLLFLHQENNKIPIEESIIIIDEPETHLHPYLQVLLIKRLRQLVKKQGQLIIATHSIHIISILDPEDVFLVDNNQLYTPSSKNISKIVNSLIGLGDDYEKFKDFCFEEFDWGFRNFIAQCFSEPNVILSAKKDDPQVELFKNAIKSSSEIVVLDFGAGGGRLGREIQDEITKNKIKYFAYEPNTEYNEDLNKIGASEVYNQLDLIPDNKFDFVILCNVLHEIPLEKIIEELNIIHKSLLNNGYIIVIEDKLLSRGENAHAEGFLLFTELELPKLMNLKGDLSLLESNDDRYSDRILCALLPKKNISEIKEENIKSALKDLKHNSYQKFKQVKLSDSLNFKSLYERGRISAFYAQQHMNASFALDKLIGNTSSELNEIEASFKGDWGKFVRENLDAEVPIRNNAPVGNYEVIIRFIIDKQGSIIDIVPETSHGYGMEEEAIRILKDSPKWVPASQNGEKVNAYRRQPITFIVAEE